MTNVNALTLSGSSLPEVLTQIPDPVSELFIRGEPLDNLMKKPRVAIVGSRRVDTYGQHVTKMLAGELARKGVVIVSGLALGVDALAHQTCLNERGQTVAVMACGIDTIYPRTNDELAKQILDYRGTLLSEHSGDYRPHLYDFLIRNRIISALADVLVVTQAAARSGTLNTVRHALEQGKTVMAVPGPITNPLCEGTNHLLQIGAVPITSTADILKQLNISDVQSAKDHLLLAQSKEESLIISLIQRGIQDGEELLAQSGLSGGEFNAVLSILEISGVIVPLGMNHWGLS